MCLIFVVRGVRRKFFHAEFFPNYGTYVAMCSLMVVAMCRYSDLFSHEYFAREGKPKVKVVTLFGDMLTKRLINLPSHVHIFNIPPMQVLL